MASGKFEKGNTPWNKGKNYAQISGAKHPNWKGGKAKCMDCDKQLSSYISERCIGCHRKSEKAKSHLKKIGFKKGMASYRKGIKMSDEQKKLISKNRTGKYGGANSATWRGGLTPKYRIERAKFRNTVQRLALERDDFTCQICEKRGGPLHVDHIKPWAAFPELRFELDNLRTLCVPCHYYITFRRKMMPGTKWCGYVAREAG